MVRGRHTLITAVILFGLTAATIPASAGPDSAPDNHREAAIAFRNGAAKALAKLGAPRRLYDQAGDGTGWALEAVGDLTGDGVRDTIAYSVTSIPELDVATTEIRALNGRNGNELWRKTAVGYAYPFAARFGPEGKPGIGLVSYRYLLLTPGLLSYNAQFSIDAIGGDGTTFWHRDLFFGLTWGLVGLVQFWPGLDLLNAIEGRADDLLVNYQTLAWGIAGSVSHHQVEVWDGKDGLPKARLDLGLGRGFASGISDLDRDGLDDAILYFKPRGERGILSARRGYDLGAIWGRKPPLRSSWWNGVGDVTGDGTGDIVVRTACVECLSYARRGDDLDEYYLRAAAGGRMALLNGTSGKTLWTKDEGVAIHVGDIDGDGRRDLGTKTFQYGGKGVSLEYAAFDVSGRALYRNSFGVKASRRDVEGQVWASSRIGDLDGDGSPDSAHDIDLVDIEHREFFSDERVVSGASGDRIGGSLVRGTPLFTSLDGCGDDVVRVRDKRHRLILTAVDGLQGEELWTTRLRVQHRGYTDAVARDLEGDGTPELIINHYMWRRNAEVASFVLDGHSGEVKWRPSNGAQRMLVDTVASSHSSESRRGC